MNTPGICTAHYSVKYMDPLTTMELAHLSKKMHIIVKNANKQVIRIRMEIGEITVNGTRFQINVGFLPVIATRTINDTFVLSLVQIAPHWIIQVPNQEKLEQTKLILLVYLKNMMKGPIDAEITPSFLNGVYNLVINEIIEKFCRLKMTDIDGVGFHNGTFRSLLNNAKFDSFEHRPHDMPPFDLVSQTKYLLLPNVSTWFTEEHLRSIRSEYLLLGYTKIYETMALENLFVDWLNADELKPCKLYEFVDAQLWVDIRDIEIGVMWDEKRRPRYFRFLNPTKRSTTILDSKLGRDLIRSDGQIASVVQGDENVYFFVWDKSVIEKYCSLTKEEQDFENRDEE